MNKKINTEDIEIIKGCIIKDPNYQALLYNKYRGQLLSMASRFVNNDRYIAEDIVQDAFIRIFKGIGSYSQETPLMGWLSTIIYNTSMSFHASNKRWKESIDVVEWLPYEKGKFSFEDQYLAYDQINSAMKKLTSNEYMYFRLYFIEGMTHEEISKDLDVPEGTSKSQVSRSCKHMRDFIIEFDKMRA